MQRVERRRIQELTLTVQQLAEQNNKTVDKLTYEIQLARESQLAAEQRATELQSAVDDVSQKLAAALNAEALFFFSLSQLQILPATYSNGIEICAQGKLRRHPPQDTT